MVATAFVEFVLFAVDDDGRDLLVHEDQDRPQDGRHDGQQGRVPRVVACKKGGL